MLANYKRHTNGLISQVSCKPFPYGFDYSDNYNKLGELGQRMAHLRLGYLLGSIGKIPENIIDVGYGNGDFLKVASQIVPTCYGTDVGNSYPLPEKAKFVPASELYSRKFEVVCFFDVLEHFDNIYDIANIDTEYFCISLPNCDYKSDEWFESWKHRKPDEHLWFFDEHSLVNFMDEIGYDKVNTSYIEDTIRKDVNNSPNILSGIFKKKL
jgi:Methyltransferase domain